jgi:hypothetical protein
VEDGCTSSKNWDQEEWKNSNLSLSKDIKDLKEL